MAESKNNVIVHGFSGKFGDLVVFRQKAGKTLATQAPGERTAPLSDKQQAVHSTFQRAVFYWKAIRSNPELRKEYDEAATAEKSGYNIALADFFHAPDILEVDLAGYTGQTGQNIKVKVVDNFKVKSVWVKIENEDQTLQEEGEAVKDPASLDWIYTIQTNNTTLTGDKITVLATDNPDNLTIQEKNL